MSSLFFDSLVDLSDIDKEIKSLAETEEERHELWHIVDEIVHHRVLGCVLGHLPHECHHEFLERFHAAPYDRTLIDYINDQIDEKIEDLIGDEMGGLKKEILQAIIKA